jgi:hypothetical protein
MWADVVGAQATIDGVAGSSMSAHCIAVERDAWCLVGAPHLVGELG